LVVVAVGSTFAAVSLAGCPRRAPDGGPKPAASGRMQHRTPLVELNIGACKPGQKYVQEPLREPMKIGPSDGVAETELVVAFRERCVPVWVPSPDGKSGAWEMQTLKLRTYGFPRDPRAELTAADVDDPNSPRVAWSSPGPTFVVEPASKPGAPDGTRLKIRLYNRMPWEGDSHVCVTNLKCNTKGPNAGIDPKTGKCKEPIDPAQNGVKPEVPSQRLDGQTIEPPNCFHGENSTNLHFHGFHVSPQAPQDDVNLELLPPPPPNVRIDPHAHGSHGPRSSMVYGHYDYAIDPLRYTQAPGTHWYHAHKHGSTALHVLNGQVGTIEVYGELDRKLEEYFKTKGGGPLVDRLMVVQQIQEKQPGRGGADQTGAVLVNGQANPIVSMKRGEIQRWRFVGATMQAAAALRIGFPEQSGQPVPQVRQIAMDGVQFSPDNYVCQPFINNPDCTPAKNDSSFDELTAFKLSPGNRVDVLVRAPDTAGKHCMVLDIVSKLPEVNKSREQHVLRAKLVEDTCGVTGGLGPLFTLVVEKDAKPMAFPERADFPAMPAYLADLPRVTDPARKKDIFYEMWSQTNLGETQFWINQTKYDGTCANETLTLDVPEQWTLWNNSFGIEHPFHIHQNPFQLLSQSDRGTYKYPVWRDVMPIPMAKKPVPPPTTDSKDPRSFAFTLSSNPRDVQEPWGNAVISYVAKEFTGGFVNHCHILGHEDRGMMHNTQAVCSNGQFAKTGPVPPRAVCDAAGFCPSDCQLGTPLEAVPACATPPPQQSDWPTKYGVK